EAATAAIRSRLQIAGFSAGEVEGLESGPRGIGHLVPLTAPVGGTIVERRLGLGQIVSSGGEALFRIADLATVLVLADVFEAQLASITPDAHLTIRTPAYPNETFSARVDRIGATVDPDKRTVAVRCVMPNGDGRLKPGMFVTVVLRAGSLPRALVVP